MSIKDAQPAPWQAERKPDPTPEEHAVGRAALAFARADKVIRRHEGARAGADYDEKVATWRGAYAELLKVAAAYEGDEHGNG